MKALLLALLPCLVLAQGIPPPSTGSGLNQLTGDVTAGPGTGSQAATLATVTIGKGGTGQVTAQAAIDALLPAQGSANGKYLTSNGTTSSWGTVSSGGVTTVATFSGSSQANGASISGANITFGPADGTNPGMVTTGAQTIAGAKTFSSVIASSVAASGHSLESPLSVKICLDGATCSSYLYRLSGDAVYLQSSFSMTIAANNGIAMNTGGGLTVDNTSNNPLKLAGSVTGNPVTISTPNGNTGVNITPAGSGAVTNGLDPIPGVHHSQTTAQVSMEFGASAATAGALSVNFATAFSASPSCSASIENATGLSCSITSKSTSAVAFSCVTGGTDVIDWQCIGAR